MKPLAREYLRFPVIFKALGIFLLLFIIRSMVINYKQKENDLMENGKRKGNEASEMTVIQNINDMLREERDLDIALSQAAKRLLDQNPDMHYNNLTAELKRKFPKASMYPIRFAADDAQESLRRR